MTLIGSSTPVVRVENVSKRFVIHKDKSLKERLVNFGRSRRHKEDFWALRDVSLEISSGSTVGLIGPNGSGKSTLLKMIGGILQPTTGQVELRGRLAALLELGAGFHPDLTGRENVYLNAAILGMSRLETDAKFDEIVDFSGIEKFIDTQVKFYSSGMYVRLAFAVAIHVDPDILLVDEVLAVGDEPFQRKCMERIERFQHEGRTIVLVTHSLDQVAQLCDRAIVLDHGKVLVDDEPRIALRALRMEFDATQKDEAERSAERAASEGVVVKPKATVTAIELVDRARIEGEAVLRHPGDSLTVRIDVEAQETLAAGWILGVRIDTPLGQNIWGTNSKMLESPMEELRGAASFEFQLTSLPLGEGEYSVFGSARLADGSLVDRKDTGPILSIIGAGESNGFLTIPTRLKSDNQAFFERLDS